MAHQAAERSADAAAAAAATSPRRSLLLVAALLAPAGGAFYIYRQGMGEPPTALPLATEEHLVNWSGTHEVAVKRMYHPETLKELEALVAAAHTSGAERRGGGPDAAAGKGTGTDMGVAFGSSSTGGCPRASCRPAPRRRPEAALRGHRAVAQRHRLLP